MQTSILHVALLMMSVLLKGSYLLWSIAMIAVIGVSCIEFIPLIKFGRSSLPWWQWWREIFSISSGTFYGVSYHK